MTYQQVNEMVASIDLPYAYYQFPDDSGQEPPFICFYYPGSDDLYADGVNYQKIRPLRIELYTDNKDFATEKAVEDALTSHGLTYTRDEAYISSERMYQVAYQMEVIING